MRKLLRVFALLCLCGHAFAQGYPSKPITIVIPLPPGGPADVMGRYLAQAMGKALKQSLVVENQGGAGGNIGTARVAKAAPDGYTLLLHHIGMSTSPALYHKLDYNPLTDFEYIGLVADVPLMILARSDFPPANFAEFMTYLRANGTKLTIAHGGLGSAAHLCTLRLLSAIGAVLTAVPYKGMGPAQIDLLTGRVDILCDGPTPAIASLVQGGKLKIYGVTSKVRLASLPSVPTLDEQGLKGFEATVWRGLYAPKGTPKPALDRLVSALQSAIRDPEFRAQLAKLDTVPVSESQATPDALRAHLKSEIERWGEVIRKNGEYAD